MKLHIPYKPALALAAAFGLVLAAAPTAEAATFGEVDYVTHTYSDGDAQSAWASKWYGNAAFEFRGDALWVQDNAGDGHRVGMHWKIGDRRGICINHRGHDIWRWSCNKNLPEGKRLTFRVGRCDGDVYTCERTTGWKNWSAWRTTKRNY